MISALAGSILAAPGAVAYMTYGDDPTRASDEIASECSERWGGVDVLVCCDSAMDYWPPEEDVADRWKETLSVNLIWPLTLTTALGEMLGASEVGSVVYLGSIDGLVGNPTFPAYSVSKGALASLTRIMAARHGESGTRVNCIATAAIVQTDAQAPVVQRPLTGWSEVLNTTPIARYATPEDVSGVALFFASSDSAYVSGVVLPVDGGRLAVTPGTLGRTQ